jgi:hypothetical protein
LGPGSFTVDSALPRLPRIHCLFFEWYSRQRVISSWISPMCSSGVSESHFVKVLKVSPRASVVGWSFL